MASRLTKGRDMIYIGSLVACGEHIMGIRSRESIRSNFMTRQEQMRFGPGCAVPVGRSSQTLFILGGLEVGVEPGLLTEHQFSLGSNKHLL